MTRHTGETSPHLYARIAGILYLIIIVCGIFSEVFIRASLIVKGDAVATATNILASEWLFRIGFAADALMILSDVAIAVLFFVLLEPVSKTLSLTAAVFRLAQAVVLGINLLNYYAPLLLLNGDGVAAAFGTERMYSLVMLFLDIHSHGYDLGLLFFGLSSLILGHLIVRSDYFPGVLGYGLMAAAVVYLTGSFTRFLFPGFVSLIAPIYIVPFIAELSFCLWLLVKGIRTRPTNE
jgi:hypothetical protein